MSTGKYCVTDPRSLSDYRQPYCEKAGFVSFLPSFQLNRTTIRLQTDQKIAQTGLKLATGAIIRQAPSVNFFLHPLLRIFAVGLIAWIGASTVKANPEFGPQSSASHAHWNFDFVEQFDGLQDWLGAQTDLNAMASDNALPKLADGSHSAWNYYLSSTDAAPAGEFWIRAFGDQRVWRGTKSAAIDLSGVTGPRQLGVYFVEGYTSWHLFFMLNIPEPGFQKTWPLLTLNSGCDTPLCEASEQTGHQTVHLKHHDDGVAPRLILVLGDADQVIDSSALNRNNNLNPYLGSWFAFELHVNRRDPETQYIVWAYDKLGNATLILDEKVLPRQADIEQKKWNRAVFGGDLLSADPSSQNTPPAYYIDDVIIDGKRIGPKYFQLIKATPSPSAATIKANAAPPSAPSGFSFKVIKPST